MRVAQILYSGLGGHGSVAFSLQAAARAAGAGWDDAMIFLGIEPVLPEYTRLCAERGIKSAYVKSVRGVPVAAWGRLILALRALRPDAIILHSVKTIWPVHAYARARGIPLIAVEHQPGALKSKGEWAASRALMRKAGAVVVLTPDYREKLQAALGADWREGKVHLIANGIDTGDFAPAPRQATGPVRVGMAARFSDRKRQDVLVGAAALLRDRDGPEAWRFSLAGDGEELPRIRDAVAAAGLEGMVDLPGFLGGAALTGWFAGLDLYTHASDGETLPTSVLQAMACGLPILGSDVPGIDTLLGEGGGCGLLAGAETAQGFAEGLTRLKNDPDLAQNLGKTARARVEEAYSQTAMFAAYNRVLEGLCADSST